MRFVVALFMMVAAASASPAQVCSLMPYGSPLGWTAERLEESARDLIAEVDTPVVEATVIAPTVGHRSSGRLRVERVLRGTLVPREIAVQRPFCGWGFPNMGERGILLLTPERTPRSFVHPEIAAVVRRLLTSDAPLGDDAVNR